MTGPAALMASQAGVEDWLDLMRCPRTGSPLVYADGMLVSSDAAHRYQVSERGIPLFAEQFCSQEARAQQAHYDRIAASYLANLHYPHTQEYMAYLDDAFAGALMMPSLGTCAEICCGRGEGFELFKDKIARGVGVDVSLSMLNAAQAEHTGRPVSFVQGDATNLPLASAVFDSVLMLGGIHHVNDRIRLFAEVSRILKPGGRFYFREPVSDFVVWRWLRTAIYRLSPMLDHETERPLRYVETVPLLEQQNLRTLRWATHGFLGFCLLMNSDVLVFNRLFQYLPGIRRITRGAARLDEWTLHLPGMARAGLQVVGVAEKIMGAP